MKPLKSFFIFVILLLVGTIYSTSVLSFEDPCADGSCDPPDPGYDGGYDPCSDGSCDDPCADGSCDDPDPCADGSCDPPVEDPCADGSCDDPDPCADGSCEPTPPPPSDDDGDDGGDDYTVTNNAPQITQFDLPASVAPGTVMSIPVTAVDNDDSKVSKLELLDSSNNILATYNCGNIATCSYTFTATAPSTYDTTYTVKARATDAANSVTTSTKSGQTTSNAVPTITEFTFPATADKNTDILVKVTATDFDGIDKIEIMEDGTVKTESCGNIVECTKEFIIHLPDSFDTVYTIVARVFDKLGVFTTETKSGKTNPAGACTAAAWTCNTWQPNKCPSSEIRTRTCTLIDTTCTNPNAVKPSETQTCTPGEELEEEAINTKIRSDDLLISSIILDPEYAASGDEILLYVSVKNEDHGKFKNLQITATVKELGIKAVSNSFTLKSRDTASKTFFFDIPYDTEPGLYYIKIEVASDSDHTSRYRIFEVY